MHKALLGCIFTLIAVPSLACEMPRPVKINIIPVTEKVSFDYTQTLAQIQGRATDSPNPYGFHTPSYTQGFMLGDIMLEPSVKLGGYTIPSKNQGCLWFDEINVNVKISPQIVIGKEVYDDECTRESVYEHEMKHVHVDRVLVNEFAQILGKRVYEQLKRRGFESGPFPVNQKKAVTKNMQNAVFDLVKEEYAWMIEERGRAQSGVDNIKEYERVRNECPESQKRLERAYRR